jgi:hypothetical protein
MVQCHSSCSHPDAQSCCCLVGHPLRGPENQISLNSDVLYEISIVRLIRVASEYKTTDSIVCSDSLLHRTADCDHFAGKIASWSCSMCRRQVDRLGVHWIHCGIDDSHEDFVFSNLRNWTTIIKADLILLQYLESFLCCRLWHFGECSSICSCLHLRCG